MRVRIGTCFAVAAALCLGNSPALAGHVETYTCKRVSGAPLSDFVLSIDLDAQTVDVPSSTGFATDGEPGSVQVTGTSVKWWFMRGGVDFDTKTGVLDWDETDEYAYLQAIGQLEDQPESAFKGRAQCTQNLSPAGRP